jgi:hypothetical protein
MTKYISGELKQHLDDTILEYAQDKFAEDGEDIAVSAYVPNPGEYTQKLPVGERTELLRLAAAPAPHPVSPPLAEEFTTPGLMQQGGDLPDPPMYVETAKALGWVQVMHKGERLGWAPAAENPAGAAPIADLPGFDAAREEVLAGFDRAVAQMFADSDARWPVRRRQVTSS